MNSEFFLFDSPNQFRRLSRSLSWLACHFPHYLGVGVRDRSNITSRHQRLLAGRPEEKLKEAKEAGSLIEASEVANVVMFMLRRPRGTTIRAVVMLPTNFDL
jgi:ribitol 2-dehydrogenase